MATLRCVLCHSYHFMMQVLFEVQAMGAFGAEEEGDLSFKDREILRVLESRWGVEWNGD